MYRFYKVSFSEPPKSGISWLLFFRWIGVFLFLLITLQNNYLNAQDLEELEELLLSLPRRILGGQQIIDGLVYSGDIAAIITDEDGIVNNFSELDQINFEIISVREDQGLSFSGTGEEFEQFIEDNYEALLQILFPNSLSEGTLGQDMARAHSQQILFHNILGQDLRRDKIGGLIEYEWFKIDSTSGTALQGQFHINPIYLAIQGRYSLLDDHLNTESYMVGLDLYPNLYVGTKAVDLWIGGDIFASGLYSRNDVFDLGLIDVGLGLWGAIRKEFSAVLLGIGAVFQGSKSFVPNSAIPDDYDNLAESVNERGLDFNISYGTILGFALSKRLTLNSKISENHSFEKTAGHGITSQTVILVSLNYFLADFAPIDVGYKLNFGLEGNSANSIFIQGNFRW